MTTQERLMSAEVETRRNIGVGLLIINPNYQIFTVQELKESENTERKPGQTAITTEKRTVGDVSLRRNIEGALGEFCSSRDIPFVRGHLFMVGAPRIAPVYLDGKPLSCSLVTLVCDVDIQPTPVHIEEVNPNGWMNLKDILALPNLRPLSRQILNQVDREGLIEKGTEDYRNGLGKIAILERFDEINSFDRFVRERNLEQDDYGNGNSANGVNGH